MLKFMILIFSIIVSMDSTAVRTMNSDDQTLKEIINTLTHMTKRLAACRDKMILDIFSDMTHQNISETFCKAFKALKNITPCPRIQHDLQKLQMNLLKAAEKTPICTVKDDSEIQLGTFLKHLMKFTKRTYGQ
ncbi:interleukin-4-like isoform X1 [Chiloscyllium plagiosum]|uniref:interleukin-4-like isoform X1 n=1 Tax=Chiloscyllium plagiosum TaxID=36176 RepID=UPI001CB7E680|nr:interleukin-4-like isoform X1 [Chiloscyllium plagiosum]